MSIGRPKVERIRVQCAACGVEVEKYPSQVAQNKTGRFFCSRTCKERIGSKPRTVPPRECEWCAKEFVTYGSVGRFCSKACYDAWQSRNRVERTCEVCGKTFERPPGFETRQVARFCSKACEAAQRIRRPLPRQHNGKPAVLDHNGYVRIYEPEHPRATRAGWQFEHRVVVERALGRFLEPSEHVHHVNGQKSDNRLENLVVLSHSDHSVITWNERQAKIDAMEDELAAYRKRYGPLDA